MQSQPLDRDRTQVILDVVPPSRVTYYKSYVSYDIADCIGSIGGLYTFTLLFFITVAYYTVIFIGEPEHMGILPELSLPHCNQEEIALVKKHLIYTERQMSG